MPERAFKYMQHQSHVTLWVLYDNWWHHNDLRLLCLQVGATHVKRRHIFRLGYAINWLESAFHMVTLLSPLSHSLLLHFRLSSLPTYYIPKDGPLQSYKVGCYILEQFQWITMPRLSQKQERATNLHTLLCVYSCKEALEGLPRAY